jgi:hypothetical protein
MVGRAHPTVDQSPERKINMKFPLAKMPQGRREGLIGSEFAEASTMGMNSGILMNPGKYQFTSQFQPLAARAPIRPAFASYPFINQLNQFVTRFQ